MTTTTRTTPPTGRSPLGRSRALLVVAGPLLVAVSELVEPSAPADATARAEAAFVLDHDGRVLAAALLGLVAAGCLVAGFVAIASTVAAGPRARRLVRSGCVLGVLGGLGLTGHMALTLAARDTLLADPTAWRAVDASAMGLSGAVTVLALVVGMNLAVLVLGVAARVARLAGWWVVVVGTLAVVSDFSGTAWGTTVFALLAAVVLGVHAAAGPRPTLVR